MKKTVFDNGFTLLTYERPYLNTANLSVVVGAGNFQEKNFPYGTAHFVEHVLFKGTTSKTAKDMNKIIDSVGGHWNAYTDGEETKYYCTLSSEFWQTGANLLLDLIWHHTLPPEEIEKERNVILEEINMYEDDPQSFVFEELNRLLHPDQPEKQSVIGTKESVEKITRADLLRFINTFYQPNNMVFVATGNVDHEALARYIEAFGFSRNGVTNKEENDQTYIRPKGRHAVYTQRDIQQSHLAWSIPLCNVYHDDVPVLDLINNLLGGSNSSRLVERVREDEGLCYSIFTDNVHYTDEGFLHGYVATESKNIPHIKKILQEELTKLKTTPLTEEELRHFKNYTKGVFALQSESNGALNDLIGSSHLQQLECDFDHILNETESVTSEDVLRVANTYFQEECILYCEMSPDEAN